MSRSQRCGHAEGWVPATPTECGSVRLELARILKSPLFAGSRRYTSFLEYVVEKTIAGDEDQLKERTIGTDVFGRDPAYDVSLDNVIL